VTARSNTGIMGFRPPCDRCRRSGNSDGCELADGARTLTCGRCQRSKIKCTFEVSTAAMERSVSGEKRKQGEKTAEVNTSPRGGEKRKRTKKTIVDAASTEEIKAALEGTSVAGPSTRPDPVALVLDRRLGEVIAAIDRNTRELAKLGRRVEGIAWEAKRVADAGDPKGKGKAMPEESEEQGESDETDGENEESGNEDGEGESE